MLNLKELFCGDMEEKNTENNLDDGILACDASEGSLRLSQRLLGMSV